MIPSCVTQAVAALAGARVLERALLELPRDSRRVPVLRLLGRAEYVARAFVLKCEQEGHSEMLRAALAEVPLNQPSEAELVAMSASADDCAEPGPWLLESELAALIVRAA